MYSDSRHLNPLFNGGYNHRTNHTLLYRDHSAGTAGKHVAGSMCKDIRQLKKSLGRFDGGGEG